MARAAYAKRKDNREVRDKSLAEAAGRSAEEAEAHAAREAAAKKEKEAQAKAANKGASRRLSKAERSFKEKKASRRVVVSSCRVHQFGGYTTASEVRDGAFGSAQLTPRLCMRCALRHLCPFISIP